MDMRSGRGPCTSFIGNNLAFVDILTHTHDKTCQVPINSGDVMSMIDLNCPTESRPVPACPDNLATVCRHDRATIGGCQVDAGMWPPTTAPYLIFWVSKVLRNDRSCQWMLHLACTHDMACCYGSCTCSPDIVTTA